jgi:hypothetical protein
MKLARSFSPFDAELDTNLCDPYTNAELTLTLKLGFRQINPPAGAAVGAYYDAGNVNNPTRKIVRWTTGSWNLWKQNLVATATRFWDGKFWLTNNFSLYEYEKNPLGFWGPQSPVSAGLQPWNSHPWNSQPGLADDFRIFDDEVSGSRYRPNIWCRLKIVANDISFGGHHHVINVVRLHQGESYFSSNTRFFDNRDNNLARTGSDSKGQPIIQRANVHEIGHLLGLGHVDIGKPHCPPGNQTNATQCYGVADIDQYSVMGRGMQLRVEHAMPWRRAMIALSGSGNVLTTTDWEPRMQKIYPRLPGEVAANAVVTRRPNRK